MTTTTATLFLLGFALIAIPNMFMRLKTAPGVGSGKFAWPWQARDRYTPAGYGLFVSGSVFWAIGVLVSGVPLIMRAL